VDANELSDKQQWGLRVNEGRSPSAEQGFSPIFVLGTPRAGTTLMARILDRHPRLFAPGETHFFEEIWPGMESEVQDMRAEELRLAASRLYHALGNHRFEDSQQKIEASFTLDELLDKAQGLGGE